VQEQTDLFGIPIPSTDKVFLAFVVIHIMISMAAVISGLVAMFAEKTSKRHKRNGMIYFWSMSLAFVTVLILSIMRWPHNIHLLIIGIVAFGTAYAGRKFAKAQAGSWTRLHTVCMGLSYVFLLTGFYVDNGKHLPFWRMFSQLFFYVFPSLIGIPIIINALLKHPLNRKSNAR
jgi:hypothetical protein